MENRHRVQLRANCVQLVAKARHHAKVTAPAANAPEQIAVFLLVGDDDTAVCQHHFHFQQIVTAQAVFVTQMAKTTAQGQTRHTGFTYHTHHRRQAVFLRRLINIGDERATLRMGNFGSCIHLNPPHLRKIQHDATVIGGVPGHLMAAAAHRKQYIMLTGKVHHRHNILHICHLGNDGWLAVDHAVPNGAGLIIRLAARLQHTAVHHRSQLCHW